MLQGDAGAVAAGRFVAGVVRGQEDGPGLLVLDADLGFELVFAGSDAEDDFDFLGRVFVGQLHVFGDDARVGRGPELEPGQAGANIVLIEIGVAAEADVADPGFNYLQANDALRQFLFGRGDQYGTVALFAVGAFDRLQRFLDVAIDPGPGR